MKFRNIYYGIFLLLIPGMVFPQFTRKKVKEGNQLYQAAATTTVDRCDDTGDDISGSECAAGYGICTDRFCRQSTGRRRRCGAAWILGNPSVRQF